MIRDADSYGVHKHAANVNRIGLVLIVRPVLFRMGFKYSMDMPMMPTIADIMGEGSVRGDLPRHGRDVPIRRMRPATFAGKALNTVQNRRSPVRQVFFNNLISSFQPIFVI